MNLAVALLAYNRPNYLAQTLENLRVAMDNASSSWHAVSRLDHGHDPKCAELICNWLPTAPTLNSRHFGLRRSAFCLLSTAFCSVDGVLYLEDDVLLSPDALRLCEDYVGRDLHIGPKDVGVGLNNYSSNVDDPTRIYKDTKAQGLLGCGFFCTQDQWRRFYSRYWWETTWRPDEWDWTLGQLIGDLGCVMWRPRLNRARNIGAVGTNASGTVPPGYDEVASVKVYPSFRWDAQFVP